MNFCHPEYFMGLAEFLSRGSLMAPTLRPTFLLYVLGSVQICICRLRIFTFVEAVSQNRVSRKWAPLSSLTIILNYYHYRNYRELQIKLVCICQMIKQLRRKIAPDLLWELQGVNLLNFEILYYVNLVHFKNLNCLNQHSWLLLINN